MIDYLFYRVYSFYKAKRDDHPRYYGIAVPTICLLLLSIHGMIIIEILTGFRLTKPIAYLLLAFILSIMLYRYRTMKIDYLLHKYRNETTTQRMHRGIYIVVFIVLCLVPIFFDRYLVDKYGVK